MNGLTDRASAYQKMKPRFMKLLSHSLACLMLLLLCAPAPAQETPLPGETAPEWAELFQRTNGWAGADGNFSVVLSPGKTLWLFSDTWVGEIRDGQRHHVRMINNSIAIQRGHDPATASVQFFYRTNHDGSADSFIKPEDGRGYFWLFAGLRNRHGLFFFPQQVETVKPGRTFGFRGIGSWLAVVKNPDASPDQWPIKQHKLPFTRFDDEHRRTFGAAVWEEKGKVYVFGLQTLNPSGGSARRTGMIAARVSASKLDQFSKWQFWDGKSWQPDPEKVAIVCPDMASEFSVSYLPALKKYAVVYTEGGLFGRIKIRFAESPIGPWSQPHPLYDSPERAWEGVFCYAGKAHPHLSKNELILTYASNTWKSEQVLRDARLYWPHFARVPMEKLRELAEQK